MSKHSQAESVDLDAKNEQQLMMLMRMCEDDTEKGQNSRRKHS